MHLRARRLNYRLSMACHETIQEKCADACVSKSVEQPCGGTVLRCLTEKLEEIGDAECKKEVFYFVKMEARPPACFGRPCLASCLPAHAVQSSMHLVSTPPACLLCSLCRLLSPYRCTSRPSCTGSQPLQAPAC